jgi:hypothetical protein
MRGIQVDPTVEDVYRGGAIRPTEAELPSHLPDDLSRIVVVISSVHQRDPVRA